jgi:hypothetical protein
MAPTKPLADKYGFHTPPYKECKPQRTNTENRVFVRCKPVRMIPASQYLRPYLPGMSTLSAGYLLPIYFGYLATGIYRAYTGAIDGRYSPGAWLAEAILPPSNGWTPVDKIRSSIEGQSKLKRRSIEGISKQNRRLKRRNKSKLACCGSCLLI